MPKRTEDLVAYIRERGADGPPDACWLWTGPMNKNGYGRCALRVSRSKWAHRAVYEILVGPIPDGLVIDHLCRVPRCVNPAHLEPVTHAENCRRGLSGVLRVPNTHCKHGHEYAEGNNLYIEQSTGKRRCRICYWATLNKYKRRVRAEAKQ